MRMTVFSDVLADLMTHMGIDQTQLAERLGVSQPTVSRWFRGSEPRQASLRKVQRLAEDAGFNLGNVMAVPMKPGHTAASVRSFVGAGSEVYRFEGSNQLIDTVELPWLSDDELEAVVVRGHSMHPVYRDGDILIFKAYQGPLENLLNRECVVELEDGRRFVKILRASAIPGRFSLNSYNQPDILDVVVRQALPIKYVDRADAKV